MNHSGILEQNGLKRGEATTYLTTLALGEVSVSEIARQAGVKRPTCYLYLTVLEKLGLVYRVRRAKRMVWKAAPPSSLERVLTAKITDFSKYLPDLQKRYQQSLKYPKVRYFLGRKGILNMNRVFLAEGSGKLMKAFQQPEYSLAFSQEELGDIARRRVQSGIGMHIIMSGPAPLALRNELARAKVGLVSFRFLPATVRPFHSSIVVFGHLTSFVIFFGEPFAVLIESKEVARTFVSMFDSAWDMLREPN